MLTPDEVQAILDDDTYRIESGDERAEIVLGEMAQHMIDTVGREPVRMFVVRWAEANEEKVRRETPNHPSLELLDEWRAEQESRRTS